MTIKAIETRYKNYRFRSRLEARWAVFFDALGIEWEYEPEGFEFPDGTRYLPDFRLSIRESGKVWFEVKGPEPTDAEINKARMLADSTGEWVMVASGTMDTPTIVLQSDGTYKTNGARITGVCPTALITGNEHQKELMASISFALMQGFYEDPVTGAIDIDDLYDRELPKQEKIEVRHAFKIFRCGHAMPVQNLGNGRMYRSRRMVNAYAAARGARFEHGENGAR